MRQSYLEDNEAASQERKLLIADWFLRTYTTLKAQDIYRWLWEGEYGGRYMRGDLSLDRLTEDIRAARIQGRRPEAVWEPLGLAMVLVKINLVTYADSGCPLKRLLMLEERSRDARPNPMRLKRDWALMKSQLTFDMPVTPDKMTSFENSIAFHLIPEISHTPEFVEAYGSGYRIAPRALFFNYFPEYKIEEEEKIFNKL